MWNKDYVSWYCDECHEEWQSGSGIYFQAENKKGLWLCKECFPTYYLEWKRIAEVNMKWMSENAEKRCG